uniref:AlNc14C84G5396 protein n=1 Tax=Albugo laibachii Nc14 TaxID=890382 RepID=F0WFL2_9STRA|nr:AlNc14C84G5396 [Albugo laibachii Nc14]|eukprot:CCA19994.1 AlNc14C84G5396 [Albugo laibachii Nc14]
MASEGDLEAERTCKCRKLVEYKRDFPSAEKPLCPNSRAWAHGTKLWSFHRDTMDKTEYV